MILEVEMAKFLAQSGLGILDETGVGGNIFVGSMPESPEECIAIYPCGGQPALTGEPYDEPIVRIVARAGRDPRKSAELIQRVYDVLHGFHGRPFIDGGRHIVICRSVQSGYADFGRDENKRHRYSLDFQLRVLNENRRP